MSMPQTHTSIHNMALAMSIAIECCVSSREGGRLRRSRSWSASQSVSGSGRGRGSQTTFNNSTFNISMYAPQRAASDKLRLGTESFGNEFIIVGILGSVPTPAAGKD